LPETTHGYSHVIATSDRSTGGGKSFFRTKDHSAFTKVRTKPSLRDTGGRKSSPAEVKDAES